ncbi:allergen Cr-PI-like [Schistocerca cancellata]|uniref:allergen Cr-PI-like n=1 Tax=Schistocerca cancellata TaxID=274614 RepID=UPI0021179385|nr:allergen Cr-PI-like [Schistocerca cancellata]
MRTSVMLLLASLALLGLAPGLNCGTADKDFLIRQKKLLQLLWHVGQPALLPEMNEISSSFEPEERVAQFKDPEIVNQFVKYYTHGYVKKRGEELPVHYKYDELQVKALVNFIHCAENFDTFYKAAAWAREHVNEDLFWYAINVVKLHRDDLFQLAMPPYYELYPQLFVSDDVINEAWKATLRGKTFNKGEPYVIHANYSGPPYAEEADELLSYFTQDVGLLAFRDFLRFRFPFWAKLEDYGQANETHRGDRFYYDIKSTLSRYNLERLSNNLPDIEPLDYEKPVPGVKPEGSLVQSVRTLEQRLWEAIDSGFVLDTELRNHSLRDPSSIEIFGRIVEGNANSLNKDYYGSFYHTLLEYVTHDGECCFYHPVRPAEPSIVGTTISAFKSPLYYKIAKRVALVLDEFKNRLGPYPQEELLLPGVAVESLTVDKLVTYFEDYDFELNNAIPVASQEEAAKLNVVARQQRLTHMPFNYHVKVTSDRERDVFIRFFIGPVYDVYGKKLSVEERRHKMVYIDSFGIKLKKGVNELLRRSKDIISYTQLPMSYTQLFGATEAALASGTQPFSNYIMRIFGDIDRLMLPRGTREGLPLCTYVIISPCSTNTNGRIDPYTKDMCPKTSLFPFDRPINELEFEVPNALFGETVIFHRNAEEVVVV